MGNFQGGGNRGGGYSGGGGGGRPSFQRKSFGGDRDNTKYKAVCDECHKECEVPFRPSSDKLVYCNDCFSNKRKDDDRAPRRDFGDRGPKRDFNNRPAQPSFSKPAGGQDDVKKQLSDMNVKLDRLVSALEKLTQNKTEAKQVSKVAPVVLVKKEVKKTPVKTVPSKVVALKTPAKKVVVKKVVLKKKK